MRQPRIVVSSVTTIASQPHASARRDEALHELLARAPVELEPARRVAEDLGDLLHRHRRLVRVDHRHAEVPDRPRHRPLGLPVRHLEHADRGDQERRRQRAAEQLDARVALGDVAQHPRHDPPAVERRPVRPHRRARARRRRPRRRTPRASSPRAPAPRAWSRRWAPAAAARSRHGRRSRSAAEGRARDGVLAQALALRSQMISTNQFKNGTHIEVDGTVFKIVEFQHVKPGKGGAFVRTKLKRADDGAVIDRTFRAGEKFRPVRTESRKMTFLYSDGTDAHFMDIADLRADGGAARSRSPSRSSGSCRTRRSTCSTWTRRPSDVQVPSAVELGVAETEPGLRGRHRERRRRQARHARVRRRGARAAVRERRRPGPRGHPLRRVRLARVSGRGEAHRPAKGRGGRPLPVRRDRPARGRPASSAARRAFTRELVEGVEARARARSTS